jgi:hypothetical protein
MRTVAVVSTAGKSRDKRSGRNLRVGGAVNCTDCEREFPDRVKSGLISAFGVKRTWRGRDVMSAYDATQVEDFAHQLLEQADR